MFNKICDAIRERRLLAFDYSGLPRVVQPYCHGLSSTGLETLRAIQIAGKSNSGLGKSGKLWTVNKMIGLRILEEKFAADDPSYEPNDSALERIHCRIER